MDKSSLLDIYQLTEFVAIDLETTGLNPSVESIIEISAVKFKNGKKVDIFSFLLNPEKPISSFIKSLTGITDEMVKGQPVFSEIKDDFLEFIGSFPIVGHNVGFDINFIKVHSNNEIDLEKDHSIFDTYFLSKIVLFSNNQFSLEALSEYYNLSIDGSHRASNDAINSALIFLELINELTSLDKSILERLCYIFDGRNIFNKELIFNAYNHLNSTNNIPNRKIFNLDNPMISYPNDSDEALHHLDSIIGMDGVIYKQNLYQYRESQHSMSKIVEDNIENKAISIIEAGTGLGKTYAYLIPMILASKKNKVPIVVSTYTKTLQEQLFHKDIKNILSIMNQGLKSMILKGRGNYICLNRLRNLEINSRELISDIESYELAAVITWSHYTKSGDIDECSSFNVNRNLRIWNLLKSDAKFCIKNCTSSNSCFYSVLVINIKDFDLIVVNHSLLALDAIEKRGLLPKNHYFVIDEAHDFFKAIRNVLTKKFDKLFFNNYLNDIIALLKPLIKNKSSKVLIKFLNKIESVKEEVDSFFTSYLNSKTLENHQDDSYPLISNFNNGDVEFQDCSPTLTGLTKSLNSLVQSMHLLDQNTKVFSLIGKVGLIDIMNQFEDEISIFFQCIDSDKYISWVKYHHKFNICSIKYLEKDVGSIISDNYFKHSNSGVLCSATIGFDNNFNHFKAQLGLDRISYERDISEHTFQTPFFLEDQLSFYSYKSDLNINSIEYIDSIAKQIIDLTTFFNKKMLVLCTSYRQASQLKDKLLPNLKNKELLIHEKGRSKNSLIRAFKKSSNAVLVGTMAFWEGIDFPGNQLSIIMMIRIPFSNPNDPYLKFISNELNIDGKNGFNDYQVPEAFIKMKQGFGRLIRSELDTGIFIITDPRIFTSNYGHSIINSFPVESVTYTDISKILNDDKIL